MFLGAFWEEHYFSRAAQAANTGALAPGGRSAGPLWHADNQGSPAGQFVIGNFRQELQVEAHARAFLAGGVVEKVDDVSPKSILGAAAFIEVERAHRIHFDLDMFAQDSAQLALEAKRSLPHLRHGESNNSIRHSQSHGWVTGESLP